MGIVGGSETRVNSYVTYDQYRQQTTALVDGGWVTTWLSNGQDGSLLGVYQQAYNADSSTRGGEVRINTYTTSSQALQQITALTDGGWVVTWVSYEQDGSGWGVYQQPYNADGSARGGEVRVNTDVTSHQSEPEVTALNDGGWVVTWGSKSQDGVTTDVSQQAYNANGSARGGEVRVNTYEMGDQGTPLILTLADGRWVVTWRSAGQTGSDDVYQQAYNVDGSPWGGEVRVNTYVESGQFGAQFAALANGGWVVTWMSDGQDGSGLGVYQQAFNADGSARGGEVRVNSHVTGDQDDPQITALTDGGWVVTWLSDGQDGSGLGVYQQAYHANGSARGGEVRVNTYVTGDQGRQQITALAGGGWVVIWQSDGQDGLERGVYQKVYDASGSALGSEVRVNSSPSDLPEFQHGPQVTATADGGWVVTWQSAGQDGDGFGVYQRAFHLNNDAPSGTDNAIGVDEDGSRTFSAADFGFTDGDGDSLSAVIITTLPNSGTLKLNGAAVTAGQSIAAHDLDGLVWTPPANANGVGLASFKFQVVDNGGTAEGGQNTDQSPNTITFNVSSINDVPEANYDEAMVTEYGRVSGNVLTGAGADTDVDGDFQLQVFNVSGASGSFQAGMAVAGRYGTLTILDDGSYTYVADNAEALAAGQSGVDVFTYSIWDGTFGDNATDTATLTITVKGTNGGTSGDDLLRGTNAAESFSGGLGNDIIDARGGNDTLNGGAGLDILSGGSGNDTYVLGAESDAVVDASGVDTITSTISRSLASYAGIENLTLLGSSAINGSGNAANNVLTGNSGANILNGGTGIDRLVGGAGNDTYVTDGGDTIVEAINQGTDTVQTSTTLTLGSNLEKLVLTGTSAINGTGNTLANVLTGNSGANILNGGTGIDRLTGGSGKDTFLFTTSLGSTNVDTVTDFAVIDDTIRLENAIFTKLTATGTLASTAFVKNTSGLAADASDRIIYETDTGKLFYDSNGSASGGSIQFATLSKNLALTYADFVVI